MARPKKFKHPVRITITLEQDEYEEQLKRAGGKDLSDWLRQRILRRFAF